MVNYKDYEKQVYDWLMTKHNENSTFTFSLRQNGSKGAELDYFIGTENSKYFSTTFWTMPVNFPGSSGDCIGLIFEYTKTGYHYFIDFNQTASPEGNQNISVLNLLKSLKKDLSAFPGLQKETTEKNKTFNLRTKTNKLNYETVEDMLVDVDKDLEYIIPLVNEHIEREKKINPEFAAHRITSDEFEAINKKFSERLIRYKDIGNISEEDKKEDFDKYLKKFDVKDVAIYFDFLKEIINNFNLQQGDERLQFSYRNNGLFFTIGQRFCWYLNKYDKKGKFGVLSQDKLNETSSQFSGTKPFPWYSHFDEFRPSESDKKSILDGFRSQLEISNKSGYRNHNSDIFETAVFNHAIGHSLPIQKIDIMPPSDTPLNQILYGPPGTGKTYNTVLEAAKIVTGNKAISYAEALKVFNAHLGNQIEFITFHQNYSYEDFIQGLRPDTANGSALTFEKKDGVFKRIADRAYGNLTLADKAPEELSKEVQFDQALEEFKDSILDTQDKYQINDAVYIFEIDEEAFRYTGTNWEKHANGIRMKFTDLKEFYRNNVTTRKDIKSLTTISGLANQHATYYLLVYEAILKFLPTKVEQQVKVERKNYVIIIDEINRANISRVFGELITLIEDDKRSHGKIPMRVTLPSGDSFIVPSNLYLIGTMNTADKSIALLDIALRRRFEFIPKYPDETLVNSEFTAVFSAINKAILDRKSHDFTIGHAYFMGDGCTLEKIINNKVIPLLMEYFMNDEKEVTAILQAAKIPIGGWPLKKIV